MKGCVKVIISVMSNLTRTIKSLPLAAVLFTCVVLLSSAAAFASEGDLSPSEVSFVIPDEYKDPVYERLAEGTRSDATLTDVYNILRYDILPGLKGSVSNSNYSLPRIAYYSEESWGKLTDVRNLISSPYVGSNPTLRSPFWYQVSNTNYSLADLQGMTWARTGDINSNLNLTNSYLSAINNQISHYNWINSNSTYIGAVSDFYSPIITSNVAYLSDLYFGFNIPSNFASSIPSVIRVYIPWYSYGLSNSPIFQLEDIYYKAGNDFLHSFFDSSNVFYDVTASGTYAYIFGFEDSYVGQLPIYFHFHALNDNNILNVSLQGRIDYIPFNTQEYQDMKSAFANLRTSNSFDSMSSDVKRLADYLADPDKIAAEQASQGVIDDTLDGFTGSGSAAAKGSDIGSMKNISGSVQSGLDSGAGVSNATNVFSLNGGFWGWFTQSNSDLINNPYPAPVVNNNRKSSGDEVVDFLSDNQSQVKDLLGESKW